MTASESELFFGLKTEIETLSGLQYTQFEPISLSEQVVAGTNFNVIFQTDKGKIHAQIFRPLPYTGQPAKVTGV